jgi:hypothetical protein
MKVSIGDLADRLVIALRKQRVLPRAVQEEEVQQLSAGLAEELLAEEHAPGYLATFLRDLVRLADANYAIWDLEFELRQGLIKEEDLAKVGARALRIRDLNTVRVGIKNGMNAATRTGYQEVKVDHVAAGDHPSL